MTLLIKGMEMPMVCDDCWALDEYGDYPRCRITEEQRGYNFRIREQRMEHCPLIEVPTPHGRLVDAHASIMLLQKYYDHVGEPLKEHAIGECIMIIKDDVPTIIEAEEGQQ